MRKQGWRVHNNLSLLSVGGWGNSLQAVKP